mgnify:CR=1 FL=1
MIDNAGKTAIFNGRLISDTDIDNVHLGKDKVYEVIRIIDGVPLFWEDHFERMKKSFKALGVDVKIQESLIKEHIETVLKANKLLNCNVKMTSSIEKEFPDVLIYISKSYYPSAKEISEGVKTSLAYIERDMPNVKLINMSYKEKVEQLIKDTKSFEVLLVNEKGQITEGSRSNLFFIKGGDVYTAPAEQVLLGVTRKYVFEVCSRLNLKLYEVPISVNQLDEMDALFISGTSIKVLPVASIDNRLYKSSANKTIESIRVEFDKCIDNYIKQRKK